MVQNIRFVSTATAIIEKRHLNAIEFSFRDIIQLPDGGNKKMATMALILTVYHCKYMSFNTKTSKILFA